MPRKSLPLPPATILHEMFFIRDDGRVVSKVSRTSRRKGELSDENLRRGYRSIFVGGRLQFAHRIVWKMTFLRDPIGFLDHINGDVLDNRPTNLREASHEQNMFNRKRPRHNTSGVKGVHRRRDNGMWRAYISANGKRTNLGQFSTIKEATAALEAARVGLHGDFARMA